MPGTRSTNTYIEALTKLLGQLGELKALDDANIEELIGIETMVLGYLKKPLQQAQQQGLTNVPPSSAPPMGLMGGMGGMGGAPGGGMGSFPMPPPGGMSRTEPQLPPVDELRRMLG